jgi:hypothetical protein
MIAALKNIPPENAPDTAAPGGTPGDFVDFAELGRYRLGRFLRRERLVSRECEGFVPDPEELREAWESFCKRHRIDPAAPPAEVPREYAGCPPEQLRAVVERDLRAQVWKKTTFAPRAKEHFFARKPALDRVVYSLLRVKDAGLARELWFRLREKEANFADLAPQYASGNEVYTGGIVGPVQFGTMHPALANVLRVAVAGEMLKPFAIAEWHLVARVEHQIPAEFDEATQAQMIEELAHLWLEENEAHV